VKVRSGVGGEAVEEVMDELGLQIADKANLHKILVDERRPPTKIDCDDSQRLVHGKNEVTGTVDALAVTKRLREKLAEHDANIFDSVVLVDV
jgi:hypothetical protein